MISKRIKESKKILLVDDHPESLLIIRAILVKSGYTVDMVSNGIEAVEASRKEAYSLVLMDINMPGMGGFEATRKIRNLESEDDRLPVIAISACEPVEFQKEDFNCGIDDYLIKPFKSELLLEKVERWIDFRPALLMFSENIDNLYPFAHISPKNWKVVFTENLDDALEKSANGRFSITLLDAAFSDTKTPLLFERVLDLRASRADAIVIALVSPDFAGCGRWIKAGFTGCIRKNIQIREFESCMCKYLEGSVMVSTGSKPENPDSEGLKQKFLINRMADLEKIRILLAEGNYIEIERVGHNMKGLGYAYGYYHISRIGRSIEWAASINHLEELNRQVKILSGIFSGK